MATDYRETNRYSSSMDPLWTNAYLGASTSIDPGKAMKDLLNLPASGIENVEISVVEPEKFEAIPKEFFAEARRMGKLLIKDFTKSGKPSPVSLHAPIIDPSGFSQDRWDEGTWKAAQQELASAVEKAAILGPSVPVTMHSSDKTPGLITRYNVVEAEMRRKELDNYEKVVGGATPETAKLREYLNNNEIPQALYVVSPATGELNALQAEERTIMPGLKHLMSPGERLEEYNRTQWDNYQGQILQQSDMLLRAEQAIRERQKMQENPPHGTTRETLQHEIDEINKNKTYTEHEREQFARAIFDKAYRSDPEPFEKPEILQLLRRRNPNYTAAIMAIPIDNPPKLVQSAEKFALPRAAETFANAAMRSFEIASHPSPELKQAGIYGIEQAPVISIENFAPGLAFGRGKSMKELVDASRTRFENRLVEEKKVPRAEAKAIADKLIGATWDVGHINMMRRYGYSTEKIAEELKGLAKDVKHVHFTDNFGYTDAHLPPGSGNVPIVEFVKKLEAAGKVGKIKGIVEAGGYVMHYGENPTLKSLQYFNSPTYGFQAAPSWGGENPAAGTYFMGSGGYSAGYGLMLPPLHYGEYGAGFMPNLPTALGAVPGTAQKSAFAGTPNA